METEVLEEDKGETSWETKILAKDKGKTLKWTTVKLCKKRPDLYSYARQQGLRL